jgi:hypothetical protein
LGPAARLSAADPILDDQNLFDEIARATRELSVLCVNELDDWERGRVLIQEAKAIVSSPHLIAQLGDDEKAVCSRYHLSEADRLSSADLPSAAAHMELAIQYAEDESESREWTEYAWTLRRRIGAEQYWQVEECGQAILSDLQSNARQFRERVRAAAGLPSEALEKPDGKVVLPAASDRGRDDKQAEQPAAPAGKRVEQRAATTVQSPRRTRWWIAVAVVSVLLIGLIVVATEMSGTDESDGSSTASSSSNTANVADESSGAKSRADRILEREARRAQAEQRAQERRARRRARERRRREARRRAKATRFSCSILDTEVDNAQRRADRARKKLQGLKGNPQAYNAYLPEVNALIDKYNSLLRKTCDPR